MHWKFSGWDKQAREETAADAQQAKAEPPRDQPSQQAATPQIAGVIAQGLLLHKVAPEYPSLAKQARIRGSVVLRAVIGTDGTVQKLDLISGHPMLAPAAIEAVKQWLYKPYYQNGKPVSVETPVVVNFSLSGA